MTILNQRMVVAVVGLIFAASIVQADDEMAIAALRRAEATVERNDSKEDQPVSKVIYNLRQVTEAGIQAIQALEILPAIEFQGTGDTEIGTSTLRALQGKPSLRKFSLSNAKMSDDSARVLGTLTSLEMLEFRSQVDLSPSGLKEIFRLTNLKELTLSDRLVSDTVLSDLGTLPKLRVLNVRSVFVSDRGLASLKAIPKLQTLRILIGAEITEVGMKHLSELPLAELDLTYASVTNAKLKSLRKFSGLKSLRFINAGAVTDEAISSIVELTELRKLDLSDAKLTNAGIAKLKSALPKCTIEFQPIKRD